MASYVERTENFQASVANVTNSMTTVTNTSTNVLASNPNRLQAWVSNTSDASRIYLSLGGTATDDSGVLLLPGDTFTTQTYTGAINAYCEIYPVWITNIVGNGTTATVTASTPFQNVENGDIVQIIGNSNSNFNGDFAVTVTGPSTFTFASTTNATGTGGQFFDGSDGTVGVMEV